MTLYLKPNENTTLILPRVLAEARSKNISYDDKLFNKTHILIVCQSAVEDSRERRDVIRKTWMKDTEKLPVVVIFLVGMVSDNNPNKTRIHQGNRIFNQYKMIKLQWFKCLKRAKRVHNHFNSFFFSRNTGRK